MISKLTLLSFSVCIIAFNAGAQSDITRYTKNEPLINWMGHSSYGGWSITMQFEVDQSQQVVSDTTFIVTTVSAAYTHINEGFGILATKSRTELIGFFADLDQRLKSMPNDTSGETTTHWFSKSKTGVMVGRLDASRSDYFTLYNAAVSKQVNKALDKL
jgi:hypothetical protein